MKLKRHKDFVNESHEEYDDDNFEGIDRHEGNTDMFMSAKTDSNGEHLYDATGDIELKMSDTHEGKLLYKFVHDFNHNIDVSNIQLTTLEGLPARHAQTVKCSDNFLTDLKGAPNQIDSMFIVEGNKLTSLYGSPEICEEFYCGYNDQLKTLKGSPKKVTNYFDASNCLNLKTLESDLQEVNHFDCKKCPNLESLAGLPKTIFGSLDIENCPKIQTLIDIYDVIVEGSIEISGSGVTEIEKDYFLLRKNFTKESYYKYFIEYIKENHADYEKEDLARINVPEQYFNMFDDDMKNYLNSLKTVTKFNL